MTDETLEVEVGDRIEDKGGNVYRVIDHRHTTQYSVNRDAVWQVRRGDGVERWVSQASIDACCVLT